MSLELVDGADAHAVGQGLAKQIDLRVVRGDDDDLGGRDAGREEGFDLLVDARCLLGNAPCAYTSGMPRGV